MSIITALPELLCLGVYAGVGVIAAATGGRLAAKDSTADLPLPSPAKQEDPIDLSLLRSGALGAAQTAFFRMVNAGDQAPDGPLSAEMSDFVGKRRLWAPSFLARRSVRDQLRASWETLEAKRLARSSADRQRAWSIFAVMAVGLLALGGSLAAGLNSRGHSLNSLLILTPVLLVSLALAIQPWQRRSQLGSRYYQDLRNRLSWMKEPFERGHAIPGIDPAYLIALFGIVTLATGFAPVSTGFVSAGAAQVSASGGGCSGSGGCSGGCSGGKPSRLSKGGNGGCSAGGCSGGCSGGKPSRLSKGGNGGCSAGGCSGGCSGGKPVSRIAGLFTRG